MAQIVLRVRSPSGTHAIDSLNERSTFHDLAVVIQSQTKIDIYKQQIKCGFPPKLMQVDDASVAISTLKIQNGDTLIVSESSDGSEASLKKKESARKMSRIVIPADNSCLFNSIVRVLENPRERVAGKATELRELIAGTVMSDPVTYNETFLGMPNEKYIEFIMNPDKWGGAIELSILSTHYQTEIVSVDVKSLRADMFGQDRAYPNRVFLLYDGIHFDAIVETLPNATERTIFRLNVIGLLDNRSTSDEEAMNLVHEVASLVKSQRQYTDVANFDLRCLICSSGVVGQSGAQVHAMETGHQNFAEY